MIGQLEFNVYSVGLECYLQTVQDFASQTLDVLLHISTTFAKYILKKRHLNLQQDYVHSLLTLTLLMVTFYEVH